MKNPDSFTCHVKEELVNLSCDNKKRLKSLLAAFIRINATLSICNKQTIVILTTENAKIAKFLYQSIFDVYQYKSELSIRNKSNLSKGRYCRLSLGEASHHIINDLDIDFLETKISKKLVANDETISSYLAGAFLASGSVNSPHTSNYHLEICLNNENYAKWMLHLFSRYKGANVAPKIAKRRDKFIIYLKKSDQIAEFLIMTGAVSSCMEFENVRLSRDVTNSTNRMFNSDAANMKKTYETAKRQIDEIQYINRCLGIENIEDEKMKILCQLRLENETASLLELSLLMSEKTGKSISKSNINHLFRKIHGYYQKISTTDK